MDDEGGLELSLGLSFGGSSSKSKVKCGSSDSQPGEVSGSRFVESNIAVTDSSFKNFKSVLENQDPKGKQKDSPSTQPQENFFTDLAKSSTPVRNFSNDELNSLSHFKKYQELWVSSNNKTIETGEEKSGSGKRKLSLEANNFQNKHEKVMDYADIHEKVSTRAPVVRNALISLATEDGSIGENEDVAESEAEGPTSWLILQGEDNSKLSETSKLEGKNVSRESRDTLKKYGVPLSLMTSSYPVSAKLPSTSNVPNVSFLPSTCVAQMMTNANGESPVALTPNADNIQFAFGYPSTRLPTLEKGSSWAFNSQPQHAPSSTSKEHPGLVQNQERWEVRMKSPQALPHDGKPSDLAIGSTKHVGEPAAQDESKSSHNAQRTKEAKSKPVIEGFISEGPAIRPGIASNLQFGGSGSYPNLPWVSTKGEGPNGKAISGVTYKYNQNQIKIVCACHGTHMSPEEFVQHANTDSANSENNPNLASFPSGNPTNSSQI
ncbi:Ninja-family protein 7 [Apostasia shenzhenica]|uniref:Ninja-family protein n=1 Tax=Apostasia shenzhenica TaxID=1088818 RepID=A0A2I0BA74_9ASPA|nr:Ninja-family protein 7 [Apostasia shenzhenica]